LKLQKVLTEIFSNGYQIQPDAFELLESVSKENDVVELVKTIINNKKTETRIITKDDIEKSLDRSSQKETLEVEKLDCNVSIISKQVNENLVEGIDGYHLLFSSRFNKLMNIVKQRKDSSQIQKISSLNPNINKSVKIAGFIMDRRIKRGKSEIVIDDDTGKIIASAIDGSVERKFSELLFDQLVVAEIMVGKQTQFFIKNIYSPDVADRVASTSKKNSYVIFTSDLHLGSEKFLADPFERFLDWVSGKTGDSDIVKRIICVIFAGDLLDSSVQYVASEQYRVLSRYLRVLPDHIKIILLPGEHDVTRRALPQHAIPKRFTSELYNMKNVIMLSNPSQFIINGVNIISYHGNGLDDVISNVSNLTVSKPAQAMKVLLRSRHLAPYYGGTTLVAPEVEDSLVIEQVPDVFHAGHLHVLDFDTYRGSVILNSGTWQAQTPFQKIVGIEPTPGIIPILNLANLDIVTMKFT